MLSLRRLIWLLLHPLPHVSPVSKLDRRHTGKPRKRDYLLMGEGGGGGESQIIEPQPKTGPPEIIQYFLRYRYIIDQGTELSRG